MYFWVNIYITLFQVQKFFSNTRQRDNNTLPKNKRPHPGTVTKQLLIKKEMKERTGVTANASADDVTQAQGAVATPAAVTDALDKLEAEGIELKMDVAAKKRQTFPPEATRILRNWYEKNFFNPYPTKEQKEDLARQTNLTDSQVQTWFANTRNRDDKRPQRLARRGRHQAAVDAGPMRGDYAMVQHHQFPQQAQYVPLRRSDRHAPYPFPQAPVRPNPQPVPFLSGNPTLPNDGVSNFPPANGYPNIQLNVYPFNFNGR